jgi:hypothetical protein
MLTNSIHGEVKELNWTDFVAKFEPEVHGKLSNARQTQGTDALVLFENLDMCSSHLGERTALRVGPGCSLSLEQAAEQHLGSVPSIFQYPIAFTKDNPK